MTQAGLDLTRGLDPALDTAILVPPDVPGFGENHAFWLFDELGRFSLLCAHLETIPGRWELRREAGSIALGDDRVIVFQGEGTATTAAGPAAGTTSFECVEPFVRWRGGFKGTARDTTSKNLAVAPLTYGPRVLAEIEFEATMAAPPWVQGAVVQDTPLTGDASAFIGGWRYEQLLHADVSLRVDGETHRFRATGLRTHRAGPRNLTEMLGHSWQTAVFPSGRAFGLLRFPAPGGGVGFSEAWVLDGDRVEEARIVSSPWLTTLDTRDESFTIELDRDGGRVTIGGTASHSMLSTLEMDLAWVRHGVHPDARLVIAQSTASFTWDGERAYGLLERSVLVDQINAWT